MNTEIQNDDISVAEVLTHKLKEVMRKEWCIRRESNPGNKLGRLES
jgi:hypothetical protein